MNSIGLSGAAFGRHVKLPSSYGVFKAMTTLAVVGQGQSSLCNGWPCYVTAQTLKEGRRITLNEVSEETGISRPTLTSISNVPGYNTNTDTISALSDYFEIEPGELLKKVWPLGANWARFGHRILKGIASRDFRLRRKRCRLWGLKAQHSSALCAEKRVGSYGWT